MAEFTASRGDFKGRLTRVKRVLFSLLLLAACDARATRAQCNEMLDKYLNMVLASDADRDLSPAEQHAAVEARKAKKKEEPRYQRVQQQCEAEITQREYRCAMKAPNPEIWQACID